MRKLYKKMEETRDKQTNSVRHFRSKVPLDAFRMSGRDYYIYIYIALDSLSLATAR